MPERAFCLGMFVAFVHCEALEPTCQNDAQAPTSVCGALAETSLRVAMSEQSSSTRLAGYSHAWPPGDSAPTVLSVGMRQALMASVSTVQLQSFPGGVWHRRRPGEVNDNSVLRMLVGKRWTSVSQAAVSFNKSSCASTCSAKRKVQFRTFSPSCLGKKWRSYS